MSNTNKTRNRKNKRRGLFKRIIDKRDELKANQLERKFDLLFDEEEFDRRIDAGETEIFLNPNTSRVIPLPQTLESKQTESKQEKSKRKTKQQKTKQPRKQRTNKHKKQDKKATTHERKEREIKEQTKEKTKEKSKSLFDKLREMKTSKKQKFEFVKDPTGILIHYINRVNAGTNQVNKIMRLILPPILDSKNLGITNKARIHLRFIFSNYQGKNKKNKTYDSKTFNGIGLKDFTAEFKRLYRQYLELSTASTADSEDYTRNISQIVITIIPENSGGCNTTNKDKKTHHKTHYTISPSTKKLTNNCLFKCLVNYCDFECKRLTDGKCNSIRAKYRIPDNQMIPPTIAVRIFNDYKKPEFKNHILSISDIETMEIIKSGKMSNDHVTLHLKLEDNHYENVFIKDYKKCANCLKKYLKTHKCNPNNVRFVDAVFKRKNRYLLTKDQTEKFNLSHTVLHYDIETRQVKQKSGNIIHTPYVVGFYDVLEKEFKYIAGADCMDKFVSRILEIGDVFFEHSLNKKYTKKLFVNAFNGSNFDHYELYKAMLRVGINNAPLMSNGSLISFKYRNIVFTDLSKHLQGTLAQNLKSFNCKVQKGDFDHEKATEWKTMDEDLKTECIKYLKSDVMGLKELYDKYNKVIFDKYKVNLTSYISTSSLSFNLWKRTTKDKFEIRLPTREQEITFRQAVRGGRCYKSKSSFTSKQYEDYKAGKISFEEIHDYMIDADVVSLYPAVMAHNEYPTGECYEWKNKKNEMMGKMGIYNIKFKANRNLQHAILGRKNPKTGGLEWSLEDGEGVYSSIEIEDAIDNGYEIEILSGYYWKTTGYVFKEYIEELFKAKEKLAKAGKKGSIEYLLSKLYMNALYGKQIQRPIHSVSKNITSTAEYWKFYSTHKVQEIIRIKEGLFMITGEPLNELDYEKQISKPTQLGVFVLAYSRRLMLKYIKEANDHFDHEGKNQKEQMENDIFYTDTDSLQMHRLNAQKIKNLGDKKLGGITDDLGDNCKIIKGLWISPKLYMLEYLEKRDIGCLNEDDQLKDNKKQKKRQTLYMGNGEYIHFHFRGKGLNKDDLTPEVYEKMAGKSNHSYTNTRKFQMLKVHTKRNSKQQDIPMFSILHKKDIKKIVNSEKWKGRKFDKEYENSRPFGWKK